MTSNPPRRPLMRRSGGFFLCLGLVAPLLAGCSLTPPAPLFPVATPAPATVRRQQELKRYRSVNDAFAKLDAKTVRAWVDRWTAPGGVSAAAAPKAVRIDTDALARRHPAWLLANAMESGAVAPDAPEIAQALASSSRAFSPARPAGSFTPVSNSPTRTVLDRFDGQAARERQSKALDRFFTSAEARDKIRGRDEAFLARRALEDAIIAAQRGAVNELDLELIPDDVALELTNLRLELLRTLSRTPAQRAASRARIQEIQARFAELWRQQTDLQAARVREATIELPGRLRREGQARIADDSKEEQEKRAIARSQVEGQAKRDLRADFEKPVPDLRLVLPATRKVEDIAARPAQKTPELFETSSSGLPSPATRNRQALATPDRFDPRIASALRSKARREAREWAALVAAQWGSRWDNNPANPDRTAAALSVLFPGGVNSVGRIAIASTNRKEARTISR